MSEKIILDRDIWNEDDFEHLFWDTQRSQHVNKDYLIGRIIEDITYDDEGGIVLTLKKTP